MLISKNSFIAGGWMSMVLFRFLTNPFLLSSTFTQNLYTSFLYAKLTLVENFCHCHATIWFVTHLLLHWLVVTGIPCYGRSTWWLCLYPSCFYWTSIELNHLLSTYTRGASSSLGYLSRHLLVSMLVLKRKIILIATKNLIIHPKYEAVGMLLSS